MPPKKIGKVKAKVPREEPAKARIPYYIESDPFAAAFRKFEPFQGFTPDLSHLEKQVKEYQDAKTTGPVFALGNDVDDKDKSTDAEKNYGDGGGSETNKKTTPIIRWDLVKKDVVFLMVGNIKDEIKNYGNDEIATFCKTEGVNHEGKELYFVHDNKYYTGTIFYDADGYRIELRIQGQSVNVLSLETEEPDTKTETGQDSPAPAKTEEIQTPAARYTVEKQNGMLVIKSTDPKNPVTVDEAYVIIAQERKKDPEIKKNYPLLTVSQTNDGKTAPKYKLDKLTGPYYFKDEKSAQQAEDPQNQYKGEAVNKTGIVKGDPGIILHDTPINTDKGYLSKKGDPKNIIPFNTKVTVLHKGNEKNKGWYYIKVNGQEGWIEEAHVKVSDLPAGLNKLYKVKANDTPSQIVQNELKELQRETGYDDRTFVHALYLLNKDAGVKIDQKKSEASKKENSEVNKLDPNMAETRRIFQSSYLVEGSTLTIPTKKDIDRLIAEGKIGSRPEWMNNVVAAGKALYGYEKGVLVGFVEAGVGAVEDLWNLLKDVLTGELFIKIAEGVQKLINMGWKELKEMLTGVFDGLIGEFEKWWASGNVEKKWEVVGKLVGNILFEVVLAVATSGVATAARNSGRLTKVFKVIDKVEETLNKPMDIVVDKFKNRKKPTVARKGDKDIDTGTAKGKGTDSEVKDLADKDKTTKVEDEVNDNEPDAAAKKIAFAQAVAIVTAADVDDKHPRLIMPELWALTRFNGVRGFSYDPMNEIGPFDVFMHGSKKKVTKKKKLDINDKGSQEKKSFYSGKISIKATEMLSLTKGSKKWNEAVAKAKEAASKGEKFQVRVKSSTEAKEFLTETHGNMNRYKAQTNSKRPEGTPKYEKGFEQHMAPEGKDMDLPHIKFYVNGTDGHIFYEIPN